MDIIKSILHVFKKSDNAFKVMHPETESACITDWNTGIVNTLASTGLSSIVNVLSSDSLLVLLIKKVFDATGVKYSIGQNGYVCFGSLVGGLIIQWGNASINDGKSYGDFSLPLSVSDVLAVFALDYDTSSSNGTTIGDYYTATYKTAFSNNSKLRFVTKGSAMGGFAVLVICK
jgi:hypothetical protein